MVRVRWIDRRPLASLYRVRLACRIQFTEMGCGMGTFANSVSRALEGMEHVSNGVCAECAECDTVGISEEDMQERYASQEGHFSWHSCDCCGSTLGGNRNPVHGFISTPTGPQLIHLDVCDDCVIFIEYGDEPESR